MEPLRSALWTEHSISLMLPPGSPPPLPAPGSLAEEQLREQGREASLRSNNPQDPEVTADTSHELAGSSPFSGKEVVSERCVDDQLDDDEADLFLFGFRIYLAQR